MVYSLKVRVHPAPNVFGVIFAVLFPKAVLCKDYPGLRFQNDAPKTIWLDLCSFAGRERQASLCHFLAVDRKAFSPKLKAGLSKTQTL